MDRPQGWRALLLLLVVLRADLDAQPSLSDVTVVTRQLGGRDYFEVSAVMNGSSPSPYRVPLVLLYPQNPAEANGTAIVDYLNNTLMQMRAADTGGSEFWPPTPIGRILLGEDFIGEYGYLYAAIQWHRAVIPFVNAHTGSAYTIPTDEVQFEIATDVGALLRQIPSFLPGSPSVPSNILAFGYSASARFLESMAGHPVYASIFASLFDGVLLGAFNWNSWSYQPPLGLGSNLTGGPVSPGGLKTIVVLTETDLQINQGVRLRGQSPTYRSYEIAGASHIPTSLFRGSLLIGLPGIASFSRQNPVGAGPVLRAMMDSLRSWTLGTGTPPDSAFLGTPFNTVNTTDFSPASHGVESIWDVPRSASSGNALGGIRLPPVEAPVGRHGGVETMAGMPYSASTLGQMAGGTFEPYNVQELMERYPTHAAYVAAVAAAADAALAKGWILPSDRDAYVATASACAVGTGVALTEAQINACFGL